MMNNRKGMEMWQLIIMILALAFLLFMLVWFGALNKDLADLFNTVGGLL